jgi:hypothetical protein
LKIQRITIWPETTKKKNTTKHTGKDEKFHSREPIHDNTHMHIKTFGTVYAFYVDKRYTLENTKVEKLCTPPNLGNFSTNNIWPCGKRLTNCISKQRHVTSILVILWLQDSNKWPAYNFKSIARMNKKKKQINVRSHSYQRGPGILTFGIR